MPFVSGETLRARLEREKQLPIADAVRIGTGVVAFRRFDPNSLIDHAQLVATPYLSAAFDWDAKAALGKVGDLLFH